MKTKLAVGIVAVLVLTLSAVYYRTVTRAAEPPFLTAAVTRGDVVQTVDATGTLEPVDTVEVGSQVTGTIQSLAVDFNDRVTRGQVIASLDPDLLNAQLQQAQASVHRLEAELENAGIQVKDAQQKLARAEALWREQLIPESELDSARIAAEAGQASLRSVQAQLVQAQASLEQSRVNVGHTVIRSPVDGIVLSRDVEVGQTVTAGLQTPTLFHIARDLGTMQVNASIDEADIGRVAVGQPVRFRVDAYGDELFAGTVAQVRLQPTVNQNVVSYTTVIGAPNPDLKLKPGMTATVSIDVAREEDVLRLPMAALRFDPGGQPMARAGSGGGAAVWQLVGERLVRLPVTLGLDDGMQAAVRDGALVEGAIVVTGQSAASPSTATAGSAPGSPLLPSFPRRGGRTTGAR